MLYRNIAFIPLDGHLASYIAKVTDETVNLI